MAGAGTGGPSIRECPARADASLTTSANGGHRGLGAGIIAMGSRLTNGVVQDQDLHPSGQHGVPPGERISPCAYVPTKKSTTMAHCTDMLVACWHVRTPGYFKTSICWTCSGWHVLLASKMRLCSAGVVVLLIRSWPPGGRYTYGRLASVAAMVCLVGKKVWIRVL